MTTKRNFPTILIILGATGDLMHKKIVPALFNLYKEEKTPKLLHIIGFSRRNLSDEEFRSSLKEILETHHLDGDLKMMESFLSRWTYNQGTFEEEKDYTTLAAKLGYLDHEWKTCANKLFYIAAPPQYYESILTNLKSSNLTLPCSADEGFTRVLIEKPFGKDTKTAEKLELLLSELFKEEQIFRIDHYLAKEMLQNLLSFRFSNAVFDGSWDRSHIEKVQIRVFETLGVEKRGTFYDNLGTLRDVGQNHLLQMLALITMDHPGSFKTENIRNKRAELLKTLSIPNAQEIKNYSYRAQYDGYNKIEGVKNDSNTETYFKIRAFVDHPKWKGVPFILESGKRLKRAQKEIIVTFKHPSPCFCPPGATHETKNRITFQFEPEEGVFIDLLSKKPGLQFEVTGSKFNYMYREQKERTQYVEEYEKLFLDAIDGDQTLFVRSDEVASMWKFVDPIISFWKKNQVPLHHYLPDSDEPIKDSQIIDEKTAKENLQTITPMKKEIGIVGLGKMGGNTARHLMDKGWSVIGFNRSISVTKTLETEGILGAYTLPDFIEKLQTPRIIWLSLPAGDTIDDILFGENGIAALLTEGDLIIDGGNSFYKDAVRRAERLHTLGIKFIDVGFSGGPGGARNGASLMIGGSKLDFRQYEQLFADCSIPDGYQFFPGIGAGHFVKMIHNGIEYGMMQAIAEGFAVMKQSDFHLDLSRVADIYNHGSVIESKLVGWLKQALALHGDELDAVSGTVSHTGEGAWTVKTAKELKVKTKIIEDALQFRIDSEKNPSYTGKILSALRGQFGGHSTGK